MKALLLAPMGSVHRRFNDANLTALRELGYEVHLAANFNDSEGTEQQNQEYASRCAASGMCICSIPFHRSSLRRNLPYVSILKQLLQKERYDLVHTHTETGGLLLRLASGCKGGSKFIYTMHGMSFYKGSSLKSQLVYRQVEKWICSKMDTNISMNSEEYDVLRKWNKKSAAYVRGTGLDLERIRRGQGAREKIRSEFGIPENAFLILSIGELNDNKNHETAIKAITRLKKNDVYYLICGVGPKRDALQKLAAETDMGERVILAGYRRDIPEIIHGSDLFVFPSYHEGLPVSVMEAMAGGLPVVCSEIRGNVDLIKNGETGYVFSPNNAEQLAEQISSIYTDNIKRKQMSAAVLDRVQDFSLSKVIEELKNIYRS